jgi:hypothetical protein
MPKEEGHSAEAMFAMLAFSACSSSLLLINKLVIHYIPMPSFVSTAQFAVCTIFILGLRITGAAEVDGFEWEKVKPYLYYTIMFVCTIYCNMKAAAARAGPSPHSRSHAPLAPQALQYSNIETIIVFRSCVPLVVSQLDYLFLGRQLPSPASTGALLVLVAGAAGYVLSDAAFKLNGWNAYSWATAYFFIISVEMAYGTSPRPNTAAPPSRLPRASRPLSLPRQAHRGPAPQVQVALGADNLYKRARRAADARRGRSPLRPPRPPPSERERKPGGWLRRSPLERGVACRQRRLERHPPPPPAPSPLACRQPLHRRASEQAAPCSSSPSRASSAPLSSSLAREDRPAPHTRDTSATRPTGTAISFFGWYCRSLVTATCYTVLRPQARGSSLGQSRLISTPLGGGARRRKQDADRARKLAAVGQARD